MELQIQTDIQGTLVMKSNASHAVLRGMPTENIQLADAVTRIEDTVSVVALTLAKNAERLNDKSQVDEAVKLVKSPLSRVFVGGIETLQTAKRERLAADERIANYHKLDPATVELGRELRDWVRPQPPADQLNFLLTCTFEQLQPFMLPGVRQIMNFKDDAAWGRVTARFAEMAQAKYVQRVAQPKKSTLDDIAPIDLDLEANQEIVEAALAQRKALDEEIEGVELMLQQLVAVVAAMLSVQIAEAWDLLNASRA